LPKDQPLAKPEPLDRMTYDGGYWYALKIAPGGLTLRHTRLERPPVHRASMPPKLRPAGPLGFPAEEALKRRGYDPFVPVENFFIRKNKYRKHEKTRVKRALIPGLVFLHITGDPNWLAISEVPMILGVLGFNGEPYRFHPSGIAKLHAISAELYQPERARPMPTRRAYEVGDEVVDLLGRFDFPLKVVEIAGETAKVLGRLFGSDYEMTAQVSQLAKWE
jgi:transcription antitermination factor NusG